MVGLYSRNAYSISVKHQCHPEMCGREADMHKIRRLTINKRHAEPPFEKCPLKMKRARTVTTENVRPRCPQM